MRATRCKCGKWADGVGNKLCWECRARRSDGGSVRLRKVSPLYPFDKKHVDDY